MNNLWARRKNESEIYIHIDIRFNKNTHTLLCMYAHTHIHLHIRKQARTHMFTSSRNDQFKWTSRLFLSAVAVAQWLEHFPRRQRVPGSIPVRGSTNTQSLKDTFTYTYTHTHTSTLNTTPTTCLRPDCWSKPDPGARKATHRPENVRRRCRWCSVGRSAATVTPV